MNPEVVNRFHQYVVKPISENSFEYIFTESCLELFLEDYNEDYLNALDGSLFEELNVLKEDYKAFSTFDSKDPNLRGGRLLANGQSFAGSKASAEPTPYQKIAKLKAELNKKGGVSGKRRKEIEDEIKSIKDTIKGKLDTSVDDHKAAIQTAQTSGNNAKVKAANQDIYADEHKKRLEELKKASEAESRELRGEQEPMSREEALKEIEKEKEQESKIKETVAKAEKSNDPGFISKVVASLRNFYKKFLDKANQEHESGKIAWYKKIARVILNYIDKLLAKLDKTKQM